MDNSRKVSDYNYKEPQTDRRCSSYRGTTHEASHVLILLNFQLSVGTFWTLLLCICNTSCHVCTTVCSHVHNFLIYFLYTTYHLTCATCTLSVHSCTVAHPRFLNWSYKFYSLYSLPFTVYMYPGVCVYTYMYSTQCAHKFIVYHTDTSYHCPLPRHPKATPSGACKSLLEITSVRLRFFLSPPVAAV